MAALDEWLYREHDRFLSGESGSCSCCGQADAFAWSDREEIDTGFGSNFDGTHFLWLDDDETSRPTGFICDQCIERLKSGHVIEEYISEIWGPNGGLSDKGRAVAYGLGVRRMQAILNLTADENGMVTPETLARLPFSLGRRRRSVDRSLKHTELVTRTLWLTISDEIPESTGRRDALVHAALGLPFDDEAVKETIGLREIARKEWLRNKVDDATLFAALERERVQRPK